MILCRSTRARDAGAFPALYRYLAAAAIGFSVAASVAAAETTNPQSDAVTDLRFGDFYKMPVGPRGLEPSARLLSLDGKTVRIRGYVVRQAEPTPGLVILSPLRVELGDADESLSDDLPPNAVFVHLDERKPADIEGLVQVTGTLSVGPRDEADGHVSQVRLSLDPAQTAAIARVTSMTAASTTPGSSQ